jgi:hypothetical protein
MEHIYPDIRWYTGISQTKGVTPRCPFASVHCCPRYYASYSLLGEHEITTKLEAELENSVRSRWEQSDLWPALSEEDSATSGSKDKPRSFWNFCPEVTNQVFGLFASSLSKYADEIDQGVAEALLAKNGRAFSKDWRWSWSTVSPMHYTECPTYSLLSVALKPIEIVPKRDEVLAVKPGFFGLSIDLRKLITCLARWWLSKHV